MVSYLIQMVGLIDAVMRILHLALVVLQHLVLVPLSTSSPIQFLSEFFLFL